LKKERWGAANKKPFEIPQKAPGNPGKQWSLGSKVRVVSGSEGEDTHKDWKNKKSFCRWTYWLLLRRRGGAKHRRNIENQTQKRAVTP